MVDSPILPAETPQSVKKGSATIRRRKIHAPKIVSATYLSLLTIISVGCLVLIGFCFRTRHQEIKACSMAYMYPSYIHQAGFDLEHTRFAQKYSLYLYREQTIDLSNRPQGVPVIFVPGNAGSYKQVRPIAAEAAAQFQDALKENPTIVEQGRRSLDFFTVDFNEDFSAFHGQTMLDQAEYLNSAIAYILSLYTESRKSPSDRAYPDPTGVIIIGHSMGGIVARTMQIMPNYLPKSINTIITMSTPHTLPPAPFDPAIQQIYQRINAYWYLSFSNHSVNPLQDVTLISIAGGGLDTIVSSDYSAIRTIVPPSNGFSVYTSTIPFAWTSADHLAILWCDQFRKVLAKTLLQLVDARRGSQTLPVAERMAVFGSHMLAAIDRQHTPRSEDQHFVVHHESESEFSGLKEIAQEEQILLFKLVYGIDLLTNLTKDELEIGMCYGDSVLNCISVAEKLVTLPSQIDLYGVGDRSRHMSLTLSSEEAEHYSYVAIKANPRLQPAFISANDVAVPINLRRPRAVLLRPLRLAMSTHSISTTFKLQNLVNSILAYKVKFSADRCSMVPITRQHVKDTMETKYHVTHEQSEISLHGQFPFSTPVLMHSDGLTITHWSDPKCPATSMTISLDVLGSFGKLVMRFRVVLIAFPFAVTLLVAWLQIRIYQQTSFFISFQQGLRLLLRRTLFIVLSSISMVALILIERQQRLMVSYTHLFTSKVAVDYVMSNNDMLLGLHDITLWWLAPLFVLISIGLLNILSLALESIVSAAAWILHLFDQRHIVELSGRGILRRTITTFILLIVVATIVPYQFAYIVACMVELATCVRLRRNLLNENTASSTKAYNYNFSILALMLCILPISLPILVVWIRNISVQWLTPFSSHHNVLSVAPIILLVECLTSGTIAPPQNSTLEFLLGIFILFLASLTFLYGVMYTYLLHQFFNILALCLFLHHHFANFTHSTTLRYKASPNSTPKRVDVNKS